MNGYKLEVIAFDIASCDAIANAGAHRIELCSGPQEGGTTPSHGFIRAAREKVNIDLFPIIRPRGGDFLYSADEFEIMKSDVLLCKESGCNGIVTGMLLADGSIDTARMAKLLEPADDMEVTFHRAFDQCRDPFEALEQIISIGCKRILTSGQKPTAAEGANLISELIHRAGNRITIMPGSGINPENIRSIAGQTGATEFHASFRTQAVSRMQFQNSSFPVPATHATVNKEAVLQCLETLKELS